MAGSYLSVRSAKNASRQRRSTSYGNNEVLTELHKTIVGGRSVYIPKSLVEEGKELSQFLREDTSLTTREKKEIAREYRERVYEYDTSWRAERLAHFVERMPDVVQGLINMDKAGFFTAEERQVLDDIIRNLSEMDEQTRAEFFEAEADLFADMAEYYKILKKYGYGIGTEISQETFESEQAEFLRSKGYGSWAAYREGMASTLRTIRRRTGQYLE